MRQEIKGIKRKRVYRHKERPIQESFFLELEFYPRICPVWASANGGSRHIAEAVALERMGVKAGVPDVFVGIPSKGKNGLFIEFKADKGKMSDSQVEMIDLLIKRGYACNICYSASDAISVLKNYLGVGRLNDFV